MPEERDFPSIKSDVAVLVRVALVIEMSDTPPKNNLNSLWVVSVIV